MEGCATSVITSVQMRVLLTPVLDESNITVTDPLAQLLSVPNVRHLCPTIIRQWVERFDSLSARIIFDKLQVS